MTTTGYVWNGSTNYDFYNVTNWDTSQSGSLVPATSVPTTFDSTNLLNGGTITVNGTENGGTLVPLNFIFAMSGGTLVLTDVTLQGSHNSAVMQVSGTTATVQTAGTVTDRWQTFVSGAGSTLTLQATSGTLDLTNALFAEQNGVINLGTGTGGTIKLDGGLVAYGGAINANATLQGNNGIIAVGGGGQVSLQALSLGEMVAFVDNTGTLALQQTGTVGTAIFGFQAGDVIDLTALSDTGTPTITVSGDLTTIAEGSTTVVLPFIAQGFTAGDFTTTSDGSGHLLLTTTLADPSWLGGNSGDWSSATSWTPTGVPGPSSNAVISSLGNTFDVTVTSTETAGSLMLLAPNGTLGITDSLTLGRAAADIVGTIDVGAGGVLSAPAFAQAGGDLTLTAGGQMMLTGSVTLPGFSQNQFFPGVGSVGLALGGDDLIDAATINDAGGLMLVSGGYVTIQNNGIVNAPNAIVTGDSSVQLHGGGRWAVAGTLAIGGGDPGTQPGVSLYQSTSTEPGGTLTVGGALDITYDGTLGVYGGSSANAAGGATLEGGQINVDSISVLNIGATGSGGASGVVIDAGVTVTLDGGVINAPSLTDDGLILVTGTGNISTLQAFLTGSGTIDIASGTTLMIPNGQTWNIPVDFTGTGSTLVLSNPSAAAGPININPPAGSGQSNTIDINTLTYDVHNSFSYDAATGGLIINGGGDGTLHIGTGLSQSQIAVLADAHGDTEIVISASPPCYAAGTRLATPMGEVPVEDLQPGDAVLVLENGAWVARRVRWVGRATVDLDRHPDPARAAPIRILAGAFADGLPHRDLVLSPEHAVFVDGVLMQAQALLNGATIIREFPRHITYLHIELDVHSVLCAEGLPAESYLDTGNRGTFLGERGVRALHPDFASAAAWNQHACAELVLHGPRLEAVRARLRARTEALGFMLTDEPDLIVRAAGISLRPDRTGCVRLPAGTERVRLTSRSFVPLWLGLGEDRRQLGVAVARLQLGGRALPAAAFGAGWHPAEPGWRWTDGAAELTLPPLPRPAALRIALADCGARYWTPRPEWSAVAQVA